MQTLWRFFMVACLLVGCGFLDGLRDDPPEAEPLDTAPPPLSGSCPRWSDWECDDYRAGCHARCVSDDIDVLCSSGMCAAAFRGSSGYETCDVPDEEVFTCQEACRTAVVQSGCVDELF